MNNKEYRQFSVHPAIIKSIINEQAGSIAKAFAELIMNARDAGASKVDIHIDEEGHFKVIDDGKGFSNREEIESFFETFGAPHDEGDATFGKFRIGRGQIMSHASVSWRSGIYEMKVDLKSLVDKFGYDLIEHAQYQQGCVITGEIYKEHEYDSQWYYELIGGAYNSNLSQVIQYVDFPVYLNGQQLNIIPEDEKWDHEDDYAYYKFKIPTKYHSTLEVYNQGVYVCDDHGTAFQGVIVSKKPLNLNMARNTIIHCENWRSIKNKLHELFGIRLTKVKKLTLNESITLIKDLLNPSTILNSEKVETIKKIKFIPDIFDELHAPKDICQMKAITVYDNKNLQVAEQVQRENLAMVFKADLFKQLNIELTVDKVLGFITELTARLHLSTGYHYVHFKEFVDNLHDTHQFIQEKQLNDEEKAIFAALDEANFKIAKLMREPKRKLKVGLCHSSLAWTDGTSYVAIERNSLLKIRGTSKQGGKGVNGIINILIHEYCHNDSSVGGHEHDFEFYRRYHNATLSPYVGKIIDAFFRRYLKALVKLGITPSADHKEHLRGLQPYLEDLLSAKKRSQYQRKGA